MDFFVQWETIGANNNSGTKRAVVGVADHFQTTENVQSHKLVESFSLPSFLLSASYDAVPLQSFTISLSRPHRIWDKSSVFPKPLRIHYGVSISRANEWAGEPRDAYFVSDDDESDYFFSAQINFRYSSEPILGISFVIQLESGQWMKDPDDNDFYIGGGRNIPACVEIPFIWPCDEDVLQGELVSLYRRKPFWLVPLMGESTLSNCKEETFFAMAKLQTSHMTTLQRGGKSVDYGVLLATVDSTREIRACIFGVGGAYSAVRLETGRCYPLKIDEVLNAVIMVSASAKDPYQLVEDLVSVSAEQEKGFCTRTEKISSKTWQDACALGSANTINSLGYCTWDAYGHTVNEIDVLNSLRWLSEKEIAIGFTIVDDGWQEGGDGGPDCEQKYSERGIGKPRLLSYKANRKFSGSLRHLSDESSTPVIAWISAIGYWGGVSGAKCRVETVRVQGAVSSGLRRNNPQDVVRWEQDYEVLRPTDEDVTVFFKKYFDDNLEKLQGVAGVKLDAQGILELLCNSIPSGGHENSISRVALASIYRKAISEINNETFKQNVLLNCMACAPDIVFNSGKEASFANLCWRTSDDHAFPNVEENADSVAWHIICNTTATLLLGEIFPLTDWDMFRSCDQFSRIHAAARVLSGGPTYISDNTPFATEHEEDAIELLKSLTTQTGRIIRCVDPGRPTRDCIFKDPRASPPTLYKVFNRNNLVGIIGVFNLMSTIDGDVDGWFAPDDIKDFHNFANNCEYISLVTGRPFKSAFRHSSSGDSCKITLSNMAVALVHVSPVICIPGGGKLAVMGQPRAMNTGGVVVSISIGRAVLKRDGTDTTYEQARLDLEHIGVCGGSIVAEPKLDSIGEITFIVVDVPQRAPHDVCFYFRTLFYD